MNSSHPPNTSDRRSGGPGKKATLETGKAFIGAGVFVAAMTGVIASPFSDLWPFFTVAALLFLMGCIRAKTTLVRFVGGFASGFTAFTALISYFDR